MERGNIIESMDVLRDLSRSVPSQKWGTDVLARAGLIRAHPFHCPTIIVTLDVETPLPYAGSKILISHVTDCRRPLRQFEHNRLNLQGLRRFLITCWILGDAQTQSVLLGMISGTA